MRVLFTEGSAYCKVPLEGLGSSVGVVSTDLTVVVDVQAVQFVEPVRDRLHGKLKKTKHTDFSLGHKTHNKTQPLN